MDNIYWNSNISIDNSMKQQEQYKADMELSNRIFKHFPNEIKEKFKRYESYFGNIYTYYTSPNVVLNCQNAPYKYICKYFDLPIGLDLNNYLDGKIIYQKNNK